MIELIINDRRADLPVDFRLPWEAFNPIFDFGQVSGNKGLRFQLPRTKTNDQIFNFAYLLDATDVDDRYRVDLIIQGTLVDEGFGVLENSGYDGYELSFGSDFGGMMGDLIDQQINRLALGTITPGTSQAIFDGDLLQWCRPEIVNPSFAPEIMVMNEFVSGSYTGTSRVIMPGYLWVIRRIFEMAGFTVAGDVFEDPAFRRLHFLSLYDTTDPSFEIAQALPELTVRDLIQNLSLPPFGWAVFVNSVQKKITIEKRGKFFSSLSGEDLSGIINPRFSPGRPGSRRLELAMEVDSSDGALKNLPAELSDYRTPGTGTTFQLKGKFGSTKFEGIDQPGNTINARANRFSPRLLFWLGGTEPVSSREFGDYALTFSGDNNLIETSWRDFERFKAEAVPVNLKARLSGPQIAKYNFHQNPTGPKSFYAFGHYFVIENIKATYPIRDVVEIKAWML